MITLIYIYIYIFFLKKKKKKKIFFNEYLFRFNHINLRV